MAHKKKPKLKLKDKMMSKVDADYAKSQSGKIAKAEKPEMKKGMARGR